MSNDRVSDFHEEPLSTFGDSTQLTTYMDITTTYDGNRIPRNDHQDLLHTRWRRENLARTLPLPNTPHTLELDPEVP